MVALQYKGRIHKSKLSARGLRYIAADRLARAFPPLQRRWLFPVESIPIGDAAYATQSFPSVTIKETAPEFFEQLGVRHPDPMRIEHRVHSLRDVTLTGWAGAMIGDGCLLTIRPNHNWVSALRPHPHRIRDLDRGIAYINLMAPMTALGHIFHWLYDSIIPLLAYLSQTRDQGPIGLIVNAARTEIQNRTIDFVRNRFEIRSVESVGEKDAVRVPDLRAIIPVPNTPRGLQSPAGLSYIDAMARHLVGDFTAPKTKRIYVSRNDARLRRVLNEDEIMGRLAGARFERVVLKGRPLPEQVSLFMNAEAVVAPHGAGLAHLTWCQPGTKVVEIFPSPDGPRGRVRNASSDYWIIAQMRGLDYSACLGGPIANKRDGFTVDADALSQKVREARINSA